MHAYCRRSDRPHFTRCGSRGPLLAPAAQPCRKDSLVVTSPTTRVPFAVRSLAWVKDPACNPKCGAKASAGYFGILLAMNLCGKVDVYGFGSNSAKEQPHYYTKTLSWARKDWQLRHHWAFERECLNELASGLVPGVTVHR